LLHAIDLVLRTSLGVLLVVSGNSKLRTIRSFVLTVMEYRILPPTAAASFGRLLPLAEITCGCLLLAGALERPASTGASALFLAFAVGVGVNLARGRAIDCGCFGSRARPIGWRVLVQDVLLLSGAGALSVFSSGWSGAAAWSPAGLLGPAGDLVVAPVLVLAVGWGGLRYGRGGGLGKGASPVPILGVRSLMRSVKS
jgi:uncharacterized membrane protein YphA (DoxX/SURF4 family)